MLINNTVWLTKKQIEIFGEVQMVTGQIIVEIVFLTLAVGAFVISYPQFKERGYFFNNAYFWAPQEERK